MLLFENRDLKKRLVKAYAREDEERAHNTKLLKKLADARADVAAQKQIVGTQRKKIGELQIELRAAAITIRDQTGADLLVNALRELGVVPQPEKGPDPFDEEKRLNAQRQQWAANQMRNTSNPMREGLSGGYGSSPFGGLV